MKKCILFITIFLIFTGCSKERKDIELLEKISKLYVDKHIKEIEEIEFKVKQSVLSNTYVFITLKQKDDYNGNKLFIIYLDEKLDKYKKPSKIIRYKDRYIVFYLNEKDMIEKDIPKALQNNYDNFWTEGYWAVLMCKNSNKYIVVDNDPGDNLEDLKQLNNFDCGSVSDPELSK